MKVRSDTKWIPSLYLESSDPQCPKRFHYQSLSALNSTNNTDSRSRSSVSLDAVREESYNIIDIINEFAPSHNVECDDDDLYPSKARSQRWPLTRKPTKLSNMLWRHTHSIIAHPEFTHNAYDDNTQSHVILDDMNHIKSTKSMMDDLWFCAGKTLEISSSSGDDESDHVHDVVDRKQDTESVDKIDIISHIIKELISVPFDKFIEDKAISNDGKNTPRDTRSSSVESIADYEMKTNYNYNSSSAMIYNEPSVSYTVDDTTRSTPIPPEIDNKHNVNTNTNTSALYEFLFDGVDTDTDDDDIFPTSFIEMDYRQSIHGRNSSVLPCSSDAARSDDKERIQQRQTTETREYVPCRPLWELSGMVK